MNWISCKTPPDWSGRFLVEMKEFGVRGRHVSTATYWHKDSYWEIDHRELSYLTPMNWAEIEDKLTPVNLEE
jgi:hypothetical protein